MTTKKIEMKTASWTGGLQYWITSVATVISKGTRIEYAYQ